MPEKVLRICPRCHKVFPTFESLISEEDKRTNNLKGWQYKCPGCGEIFPIKELIVATEPLNICARCGQEIPKNAP